MSRKTITRQQPTTSGKADRMDRLMLAMAYVIAQRQMRALWMNPRHSAAVALG